MIIRFFATFRQYTGEKESKRFYQPTMATLLQELCRHYGEPFASQIFIGGKLSSDVLILINGRAMEHWDGLETVLQADDTIAIFPKIAGG